MRGRSLFRLAIGLIALALVVSGMLLAPDVEAQQPLRLRLPFEGLRRVTAYVDHKYPTYGYPPNPSDQKIVVYHGEERLTCPEAGASWTNEGPYCYDGHDGTDYSLPNQTPVLAAAPGTVSFREWAYGWTIEIDHGSGYVTRYSHLAPNSWIVDVGDTVKAGQQIALSGESGSPGSYHLHFGVYHNGYRTDPYGWRGEDPDPLIDYSGETAVCLWGDGQCSEIVIEDESAWFYKYGSGWDWHWRGYSWTMRRTPNGSGSTYARWRPDLSHEGPYEVLAFVPAVHATTRHAEYTVHDREGDHPAVVNQLDHSDEWVSLGTYDFWNGIIGYVYLNNATGESAGSTEVCFDAVKFRQFRVNLPLVLNNYCTPHYGEQLINGNFNTGDTTGWAASRSNCPYPIVQPMGSSEYAAWLGRCNSNADQLYQTICLPSQVGMAKLAYSWWIGSQETGSTAYDFLRVRIRDANGNLLQTLQTLTNLSPKWNWYVSEFDLRAYAGQTIRVSFEATNDFSLPTDFWIENVSLYVTP